MECYKLDIHSFLLGKREDTYEDFLQDIFSAGPEDCRYGLYDFEYQHQCEGTNEKSKKEKLLLMSWCPDTAKIKKKMLYSSSFDALKKMFGWSPKVYTGNVNKNSFSTTLLKKASQSKSE